MSTFHILLAPKSGYIEQLPQRNNTVIIFTQLNFRGCSLKSSRISQLFLFAFNFCFTHITFVWPLLPCAKWRDSINCTKSKIFTYTVDKCRVTQALGTRSMGTRTANSVILHFLRIFFNHVYHFGQCLRSYICVHLKSVLAWCAKFRPINSQLYTVTYY